MKMRLKELHRFLKSGGGGCPHWVCTNLSILSLSTFVTTSVFVFMPTIEVKPKVFITNSFLQPIPFYNHFQHEGVLLCFGNKCEDSKPLSNKIHSLAIRYIHSY